MINWTNLLLYSLICLQCSPWRGFSLTVATVEYKQNFFSLKIFKPCRHPPIKMSTPLLWFGNHLLVFFRETSSAPKKRGDMSKAPD